MPRSAYPTVTDMQAFLTNASVIVENVSVLEGAVAAGIAQFEQDCGNRKMLADDTATTRFFTPPTEGASLILEDDLATLDSVVLQVLDHDPVTLTSGVDYYPQPDNALVRGKPVQRLDLSPYRHTGGWWFSLGWWGPQGSTLARRGSVHVTGRWGYGTLIPDDAWLAMLYGGLAAASGSPLNGFGVAISPYVKRWSANDSESEEYDVTWFRGQMKAWQDYYDAATMRYRRMTL